MVKRIIRNRRLTPEEAAKYKLVREQIAEELPELIERHIERISSEDASEDQEASADEQHG